METAASIHPLPRTRASCPQRAGLSPAIHGGPGLTPSCLAGVPPDPLPSMDITWSLGGGCPTHLPSLLSCNSHQGGGPWSQVCCWLPWGPPLSSSQGRPAAPHPQISEGIPPPSLHPPQPGVGGGRRGTVQFLLIPTFRQSPAPPLPRERPEQSQVCSPPHTHTPKISSPFPSHNQIQM